MRAVEQHIKIPKVGYLVKKEYIILSIVQLLLCKN